MRVTTSVSAASAAICSAKREVGRSTSTGGPPPDPVVDEHHQPRRGPAHGVDGGRGDLDRRPCRAHRPRLRVTRSGFCRLRGGDGRDRDPTRRRPARPDGGMAWSARGTRRPRPARRRTAAVPRAARWYSVGLCASAVLAGIGAWLAGSPLPPLGPVVLLAVAAALCVNRFALFPTEHAATAEAAVLLAAVVGFRTDAAIPRSPGGCVARRSARRHALGTAFVRPHGLQRGKPRSRHAGRGRGVRRCDARCSARPPPRGSRPCCSARARSRSSTTSCRWCCSDSTASATAPRCRTCSGSTCS